jgi:transcriptional regulator with XRE-family HTH domain
MNTNNLDTATYLEQLSGGSLTLGKLINSIRMCDEISQVEFANKLGISRQHLCDIEHDRKIVSPKLAAQYATILGYPVSQFIRLALQAILDRDNLDVAVDIHFRHGSQQINTIPAMI